MRTNLRSCDEIALARLQVGISVPPIAGSPEEVHLPHHRRLKSKCPEQDLSLGVGDGEYAVETERE